MKVHTMPCHVDDPKIFLFFSIDELVPIGGAVVAGIIIDHLWYCLLAGMVLAKIQRKYVDSMPDGFMYHALYWWGLVSFRSRGMPPSLKRVWSA